MFGITPQSMIIADLHPHVAFLYLEVLNVKRKRGKQTELRLEKQYLWAIWRFEG